MRTKLTEKQKQHRKVRKMWVKALRSGEYVQGQNQLCTIGEKGKPDMFCCLGVLCDLAVRKGLVPTSQINVEHDGNMTYFDEEYRLPSKIQKWVGLSDESGTYKDIVDEIQVRTDLVTMNDDGFSFDKIADIIESAPEGMFVD